MLKFFLIKDQLHSVYLRRGCLFLSLLFAFSIIFSFSYLLAVTYVCPNHIGSMFKMAVDVANGMSLYGQTYSQYGPVPTWIQAAALVVFGKNVIVSAMITMTVGLLTLIVLQAIWRRFLSFPYVAIAVILQAIIYPNMSFPWPNIYLSFFSALVLWSLLIYFQNNRIIFLIAAGFYTATAILCRQQGIILFLFVLLCLFFVFKEPNQGLMKRAKMAFWYLIASLLPIVIYLGYLQSKHMLVDFYKQTMLIIPVAYTSGNLSIIDHIQILITNFFIPDKSFFISTWCLIGMVCIGYMMVLFFRKDAFKDVSSRALFLCSGFALIGLLNAYPLPDDFRYVYGMAPATGVLIYLIINIFSKLVAPFRFILMISLLSILFYPSIKYVYQNYYKTIPFLKRGKFEGYIKVKLPAEIAGTYHPVEDARFYQKLNKLLTQYVERYPDTTLISLGVEPLFLTFISQNKNAHQMPFFWWSKSGTMYDGGEKKTINMLLYPDYLKQLQHYINRYQPLLYTYGQLIEGYQPIFEHAGGAGFPLYWANQWHVRPIVSIQAPIARAQAFLTSVDTSDFFNIPERIIPIAISGQSFALLQAGYPLKNLFDSRMDTFISYTSNSPFEVRLNITLKKQYKISKITLYPRIGHQSVLPQYINILISVDGNKWESVVASYSNIIDANQTGAVFSFNPVEAKFIKLDMHSSELDKTQFVQISEIIFD